MKNKYNHLYGKSIGFKQYYNLKATNRFSFDENNKGKIIPYTNITNGLVIGFRHVLFDDVKWYGGNIYGDSADFEPAYLTGKKKWLLLVSHNPYRKHILVDPVDLI